MAITLKPHQLKALGEMKNGCILKGGVGTGKSLTAIGYFFTEVCGGDFKVNGIDEWKPMATPKDLYIITTAKKRDKLEWESEAAHFMLGRDPEHSFGGVKVHVDSWNNIINYTEVKNAFFIFDEQRLVGSGAWVKAFYKIAEANEWVVLSATPGDNWMDYIPVFVANGYYKNRTEFIRRHVVFKSFSKFPAVDHYVETGRLLKLRNRLIIDMPYERHTVRHVQNVIVEHDERLMHNVVKDRWNVYEDRPIRDIAEMFRVARRLANSDPSRLYQVIRLAKKHPRLIIFYNFNYELEDLRTLSEILDIEVSEWNGHKHEELPTGDRWVYLVQYTAGSEGWNCTTTDAEIFYSLNYSYKLYEQAQGRIDRLNTPYTDLFYYVFWSNSMIDKAIHKAIVTKKSFNEYKFAKEHDLLAA